MRKSHVAALLGVPVLTSISAIALAAPPSWAAARGNSCPAGYTLMSVADLSALGYTVPAQVDSPTSGILSFGQPGNGDGYVCAVKLGNQLTPWNTPIYNYIDNQLPA
jgi:hypothetical protein